MHNGSIAGFRALKRDLVLAVDPELYPDIEGSTDSELLFYLALTFGLATIRPPPWLVRCGLVEETGRRHGVEDPMQMTVATTDGETTWAFRYSSVGRSRSLFHSTDVSTLRQQYPDNPLLQDLSEDAGSSCQSPWATWSEHGARCPRPPASPSAAATRRWRPSRPRCPQP